MELTLGDMFKVEQDVEGRTKEEGEWPPAAGWTSMGCWSILCFLLITGLIKSEARGPFCKDDHNQFCSRAEKAEFLNWQLLKAHLSYLKQPVKQGGATAK